jgi:membrane protein implicated in regulation of membrane protease activity
MNWETFFLGCFVLGFALSAMSFLLGAMHAHWHLHLPWGHGHVPGAHVAHGHAIGPINFATIMAFLAWFGGAGYLLTAEFGWIFWPAVVLSIIIGLIGGGAVFMLMSRVLWSSDENMQSADYEMVGVLGRLTQPIRAGGIGELVYVQGGTRKSCGARSDDGLAIDKGSEVVVTAYERGIAMVRRWTDLEAEK